jgi:DNA-binding LytR/AlgR family response regulator
MKDLNCLIVEDEHLAAEVIRDYIRQVPGLKLAGICEDVMMANDLMNKQPVDLIFLDINLPGISGIEFIKSLNRNYDVILTTAYHQYAVEGYSLNVVDYLLKPIEFSRFLKAINKVFEKRKNPVTKTEDSPRGHRVFFFNTGRKQVKVPEDEIMYIESLKDYVKIHMVGRSIVTKYQIGQMHELLGSDGYLRVHKSYVVKLDKITAFNASEIEVSNFAVPIGRTYKEMVDRVLARVSGK